MTEPRQAAHIRFVRTLIANVDTICAEALEDHARGIISSQQARKIISGELVRSGVAESVAGERYVTSAQLRYDLIEDMNDLLISKVLKEAPGCYDLELGKGASATGWARQLLRAARGTLLRNIHTRTAAKVSPVDPTPQAHSSLRFGTQRQYHFVHGVETSAFHESAVTDDYSLEGTQRSMEDAADWLSSKTRHLRENSKLAAHAASLLHAYGVPSLVRPRLEERRRLQALIAADPFLASRSVEAMKAIVESEPLTTPVDDGLLCLWDEYSYNQLEAISEADGKVARVLVDAALADRTRPSRTILRSFRASVRSLGKGLHWNRLADECAEAFIALEFEAFSAFDSTGAEFHAEKSAGHMLMCRKAPGVFARTLAHPGQRLGRNEKELYEQLDLLISNLTDLEVKAPEAA